MKLEHVEDFIDMAELLSRGTPPWVLASVIEKHGIYTWDRYGRFIKAKNSNEWYCSYNTDEQRYKLETKNEVFADSHTVDVALSLLEYFHKTDKYYPPDTWTTPEDPNLGMYGWPMDALLNLKLEQPAKTKPSTAETDAGIVQLRKLLEDSANKNAGKHAHSPVEKKNDGTVPGKRKPQQLKVTTDDINEIVTVVYLGVGKEQYKRADVVGKGSAIWDLLIDFSKHKGSLEGVAEIGVKKRNTSANRINLGKKLVAAFNLCESPIVENRKGLMRFESIELAGGSKSVDALDRKTVSLDDQGTAFLERHGDGMPPKD